MIRDEEIKRLVAYANGMGIKVNLSSSINNNCAAEWVMDGSEITVYLNRHRSKIQIVMSLIHELGHHISFIHDENKIVNERVGKLYQKLDADLTKKERLEILKHEEMGIRWWNTIVKEVNIRIPRAKLEAQKRYDLWQYEYFAEKGEFPTILEKRKYLLALRKKK
jgi:hypothetical protein